MTKRDLTSSKELRRRRPPNRERVDDIKRELELELALQELREKRGITQLQVAEHLMTSRPNVARIEREKDVRLSTLRRYAEALGGTLEISVRFPDGSRSTLLGGSEKPTEGRTTCDELEVRGRVVETSSWTSYKEMHWAVDLLKKKNVNLLVISKGLENRDDELFGFGVCGAVNAGIEGFRPLGDDVIPIHRTAFTADEIDKDDE
jgi:transcriptional regulator with XRE-family HTH domain